MSENTRNDEKTDITTCNYLNDVTAYRSVLGSLWALDVTLLEKVDKKYKFGQVSKRDRMRGFLEKDSNERKLITTQFYVLDANVVLDITNKNIAKLTDKFSAPNLDR